MGTLTEVWFLLPKTVKTVEKQTHLLDLTTKERLMIPLKRT